MMKKLNLKGDSNVDITMYSITLPWLTWILVGIPFCVAIISPLVFAEWIIRRKEDELDV